MAFYGAIEQLLTGWIFGLRPQGEREFERAKWLVVETVCGGLERGADDASSQRPPRAERR
jgi:TetR/AcrR family fatty acid metabolism transcriptional regulator